MLILYYTSIHRETLWGLCYKQAGRDLPWTCRLRCSKICLSMDRYCIHFGNAVFSEAISALILKPCSSSAWSPRLWTHRGISRYFSPLPPMFASVAKRGVVANALLILMKLNWVTSTNNIMKLLKLRCDSSVTLSSNSPKRDSCCSERNERLHSSAV